MTGKILTIMVVLALGLFVACKSTDDAKITSDIKTQITDDSRLDAAKIDVDTKDGVVTLSGKVLGKQEENRAIHIAQTTPGVTNVVSKLEVDTQLGNADITDRVDQSEDQAEKKLHEGSESVGQEVDDASITTKVKFAFAKDPEVSAMKIDVDTKNGVVTLTGKVKSETEAKRAVSVAETVNGVKSVNSVLTVGS
jgi:hyperosmotically inducible periplasmic protein